MFVSIESYHCDRTLVFDSNISTIKEAIKSEIIIWLNDNDIAWTIDDDKYEERDDLDCGAFVFFTEEDAMAFKLQWVEDERYD